MHNIQRETIYQYQTKYPNDTLRDIASKTGIQLTRVFRIINGYEMKLKEYLSFQKSIHQTQVITPHVDKLQYINQHFFELDEHIATELKDRVEYSMTLKELTGGRR